MIAEILKFILSTSLAKIKCDEYSFQARSLVPESKSYTQPLPLIIGGEDAMVAEFPHMAIVAFQKSGSPNLHWACGGTLISEVFVLTAAHCSSSPEYGKAKKVRLGSVSMKSKKYYQERAISEIITHPDSQGYYNDIALFRLDIPVEFNLFVRPACLDINDKLEVEAAIATGFGVTDYSSSDMNENLKKVNLTIYPNDKCKNIYNEIIKDVLPNGILSSQLCSGSPNGDSDTCQGDSGGPLQIPLNGTPCMYSVIGITSFGLFCGQPNMPSFYTRVYYYLDWIEKIVWSS